MSRPFTTTTANWQSRLNVTASNSIAAPYDYGVAFGDSAGYLYAQAGRGGSNALATGILSYNTMGANTTGNLYQRKLRNIRRPSYLPDNKKSTPPALTLGIHQTDRMSMTANIDSNNIAWYFGGRTENADSSMTYVRILFGFPS